MEVAVLPGPEGVLEDEVKLLKGEPGGDIDGALDDRVLGAEEFDFEGVDFPGGDLGLGMSERLTGYMGK